MKFLPTFRLLESEADLVAFSEQYYNCSGLPIPQEYLNNKASHVFGISYGNKLVGGFILGKGIDFRTLLFFCKKEQWSDLYQRLKKPEDYTEICCFWISPKYRTNTYLNFFTWLCMTYALRKYGSRYFLFGTCSKSLARLYGQTKKSILIHQDRINKKSTFIFYADRNTCVTGMLEIIKHKLVRTIKSKKKSFGLAKTFAIF